MSGRGKSEKKSRPISRKFWNYLSYLPKYIRKKIIRSKFEVSYDLPKEIVLKQAETEDEISQALKLVYDSYIDLGYIDENESRMRFSKFHAVPTSVMLIIKWEEEVIGTITIMPDSALGLPCDTTWSLEKFRAKGQLIGEISSLSIKKNFKTRRGTLLLPLCKIMLKYCTEVLHLDGIVIATTMEVEPFYTDILLFDKIIKKTGQEHQLVNGNPSTCCFLEFANNAAKEKGKKVYNHLPKNKNLYHFFFETETPNIIMPEKKSSIHAYMSKNNAAKGKLMKQFAEMSKDFTEQDKLVLMNLDISGDLPIELADHKKHLEFGRTHVRPEVYFEAWCFLKQDFQPMQCQVLDISENGFKLRVKDNQFFFKKGDKSALLLKFKSTVIKCEFEVCWVQRKNIIGCRVTESGKEWQPLISYLHSEIYDEAEGKKIIKITASKRSA